MKTEVIRVLLVEDDEDDYVLTRDMLSEIGGAPYHLDWAATYEAGLEAMLQRKHDIYLLDYRLGERSGLELLREVRARRCDAPLILLTGQGDRSIDLAAMKEGAADYLVKGMTEAQSLDRAIRYAIEHGQKETFLESEKQLLEMIATGKPLPDVLARLCKNIEQQSPELVCSILLLDADGHHLRHGAAPSLPATYSRSIDGVAIGPNVGSCGTAAYRKERVIVTDIESDPLWTDFRDVALAHNLRACWSTPILGCTGLVLGTFALYFRVPHHPNESELRLVDRATHLATIAIERHRTERALSDSDARYRILYDETPSMYFTVSPDGTVLSVNRFGAQRLGYRPDELIGGSVLTVVFEDDREAVSQGLTAAFADPTRVTSSEFRKVKKDGELIWVREAVRVLPAAAAAAAAAAARNGPVVLIVCENITEQKKIEQEARRQARLLESFWKFAPVCLVILDRDFNFIRVNDMYAKACGREVSEFPGHNHFEFYPSDAQAIFEQVRATKTPFQILAHPFVFPDHLEWGTTYWDWSLVPILDTGGEVELLVFSLSDVTERKRAEEALRESENHLRGVLDALPVAAYTCDAEGLITYFNKRATELWGRSPRLNHPEDRFCGSVRLLRPDGTTIPHDQCWMALTVTEGRAVDGKEAIIERPDGSHRSALAHANPMLDSSGRLIGAVNVLFDVTERNQLAQQADRSERLVASILENLPHMIFVKDAENLRFVQFNRAGEDLLGIPRQEMLGKSDYDFFPKEQADFFTAKDREVLSQSRLMDIPEEPIQTKTGGTRYLHTKKIPLLDETGRPQFLLGISEDITEHKRLEQRLRQAEKMEAIGTLAGGIAHDFNNILAAMIGYTELAQDGVASDSRARQNLDQVLVAGRRGKALIQQILAFSRQREPQREVIALDQLLQEATILLRASIPTTIDMHIDLQAAGSQVSADSTQLQQVMMNLCSNAAQAMQAAGGTLKLRLEEVDLGQSFATAHPPLKPGPHIRLTVQDTGVGMTPEVMARIFDPFFTTKKVGEGTGLGLSAALGIITSHGGTITVQSERGRGSTFSVYLPKLVSVADPAAGSTPAARGGSERILFVDDETMLARLAEQMLGNLGYRVTAMTDPVLALGQFRNAPDAFDLVMTDHTMPGMTGEALTRELRRTRPDLPVILCTGYTQGFNEETARELGISAFLMKPLEVAELDQAIRQALNRSLRSGIEDSSSYG